MARHMDPRRSRRAGERFLTLVATAAIVLILSPRIGALADYSIVEGAGQVPLNVIDLGDKQGPSILLIHGIGQSHLSWERQLDSELTETYRLVAFDLRGHGNSGKPWQEGAYADSKMWADDIDRLISALELDRPVLVGWSYGSLVVLDYVRHYGTEALSGINLVGGYGGLTTPDPPDEETDVAEAIEDMRQKQYSPNISDNLEASQLMVGWLTAKEMTPEWHARAIAIGVQLPPYARRAMWARAFNNQDLVQELTLPVLLTVGREDLGSSVDQGEDLAARLPDGTVSVYDDVGHSPFLEDPERFNDELKNFMQRVARD